MAPPPIQALRDRDDEEKRTYSLIQYRIVVLDYDPMTAALLETIIRTQRAYDVCTSPTPSSIFRLVEDKAADLILLDTNLPNQDSHELCRQLKSDPRTQRIPIILLSSQPGFADRSMGLKSGADAVVSKPFHRNELLLSIRSCLRIKTLHDQLEEVEKAIVALGRMLEARDQYTQDHTEIVTQYAEMIGRAIGLDEEDLQMLHRAALLHDIGKVGIPELLLKKPGVLTEEEMSVVRERSVLDEPLQMSLLCTPRLLPIIRHQHEHVDGNGYPDHLVGDQIPLGARILSIADSYAAMTSKRPYREALSMKSAQMSLQSGAGSQWDEHLIAVFLDCLQAEELVVGSQTAFLTITEPY